MKEALIPPPHCAACYQTGPEKRYIDFEAAYDGPVIPGTPANQPVDDLIICEECLQSAFSVLDPDGSQIENERLMAIIENLDTRDEAKDRMIQRLESTLHELVDKPVKRRQGAQEFAGIPPDVRKALNKRRQQRKAGKEYAKRPAKKKEPVNG
jgi:hypothetical protein